MWSLQYLVELIEYGTAQYFDRSTGTEPILENETYSDNENSQKMG